eukprot:g4562.t1
MVFSVQCEVLGTGAYGTCPTLLISVMKKSVMGNEMTAVERLLFNVGENTQRICMDNKIKLRKLSSVFFSRLDADSCLGAPGLIMTLSGFGSATVQFVGPVGTSKFVHASRHFVKRRWPEVTSTEIIGNDKIENSSKRIFVCSGGTEVLAIPLSYEKRVSNGVLKFCSFGSKLCRSSSSDADTFDRVSLAENGEEKEKKEKEEPLLKNENVQLYAYVCRVPFDTSGDFENAAIVLFIDCPSSGVLELVLSSDEIKSVASHENCISLCLTGPSNVLENEKLRLFLQKTDVERAGKRLKLKQVERKRHLVMVNAESMQKRPLYSSFLKRHAMLREMAPCAFDALHVMSKPFTESKNLKNLEKPWKWTIEKNGNVYETVDTDATSIASIDTQKTTPISSIQEMWDKISKLSFRNAQWGKNDLQMAENCFNLFDAQSTFSDRTSQNHSVALQLKRSFQSNNETMDDSSRKRLRTNKDIETNHSDEDNEKIENENENRLTTILSHRRKVLSHRRKAIAERFLHPSQLAVPTRVIFLGTTAATPTKHRNCSSIYVTFTSPPLLPSVRATHSTQQNKSFDENGFLLDCGEGTFGQLLMRFGIKSARRRIENLQFIWISHKHLDHHGGLLRILEIRSRALHYKPLVVIGPHAVGSFLSECSRYFVKCQHVDEVSPRLPYVFVHCQDFNQINHPLRNLILRPDPSNTSHVPYVCNLFSVPVVHCPDSFAASVFISTGQHIVFSGDTRPCREVVNAAKGATLLIHEATFDDDDDGPTHAQKKRHSTVSEAASVAFQSRAERTVLTHFSSKYRLPIIPSSIRNNHLIALAFDMMEIRLPLSSKGRSEQMIEPQMWFPALPLLLPAMEVVLNPEEEEEKEEYCK